MSERSTPNPISTETTDASSSTDGINVHTHFQTLGELAAGVAHEINTPLQYISDNTRFVQEHMPTLLKMVQLLQACPSSTALPPPITELLPILDSDFLQEEIPRALQQTLDGLEQIISIVHAMKQFSHQGKERVPAQVNELIRYALTLSRSEWKYCATITLSLSDDLPQLVCVPSALSQVILNLLTNAAHAIQDASGNSPRTGEIKVSTRLDEDSIEITISDTGCGIPLALQEKVFEPFFTTKKAGRGSGQGLALARSIVTEQHKGSLTLKSAPGEGTTFTLRFPLE